MIDLRRPLPGALSVVALLIVFAVIRQCGPADSAELACGQPERVLSGLKALPGVTGLQDFAEPDAVVRANRLIAGLQGGRPPQPMPDRFIFYRVDGQPLMVVGVTKLLCQPQRVSEDFADLILEALQPQNEDGAI